MFPVEKATHAAKEASVVAAEVASPKKSMENDSKKIYRERVCEMAGEVAIMVTAKISTTGHKELESSMESVVTKNQMRYFLREVVCFDDWQLERGGCAMEVTYDNESNRESTICKAVGTNANKFWIETDWKFWAFEIREASRQRLKMTFRYLGSSNNVIDLLHKSEALKWR